MKDLGDKYLKMPLLQSPHNSASKTTSRLLAKMVNLTHYVSHYLMKNCYNLTFSNFSKDTNAGRQQEVD